MYPNYWLVVILSYTRTYPVLWCDKQWNNSWHRQSLAWSCSFRYSHVKAPRTVQRMGLSMSTSRKRTVSYSLSLDGSEMLGGMCGPMWTHLHSWSSLPTAVDKSWLTVVYMGELASGCSLDIANDLRLDDEGGEFVVVVNHQSWEYKISRNTYPGQ